MPVFRAALHFFQQRLLLSVIILAFLIRFVAIFFVGSTELEHEYAPLVLNMVAGRGFVYYSVNQDDLLTVEFIQDPKMLIPSAFKSPVYPFFLAFFVKLFGADVSGIYIIETVQAILGSICCWLVYKITLVKFNKPQALLAATGMAFYPLLVYSSTQISDTIIFLFLEILTLWLFIKLEHEFSAKTLVIFSISFGLFVLARTEGFLYLPFFLLWLLWRCPKRKLYYTFLFIVFAGLVILPWGARNYFQMGKFTLNTAGGLNFWEGQNRNAVGVPSWYVEPPVKMPETLVKDITSISYSRGYEAALDNVYLRAAMQDIWADPGHSVALAFRKAFFFWTALYWGFNFVYPGAKSALYWLPWVLMLPFFVYGLFCSLKEYKQYLVFFLVFIVSTFVSMVFVVLPRYTMAVYPGVIIFAAHGAWRLLESRLRINLVHLSKVVSEK